MNPILNTVYPILNTLYSNPPPPFPHPQIPLYHSLLCERLGEQIDQANQYAVPYTLLMPHKEPMEGTVLVREVATNSQDAIPLPELTNYLKRHRVIAA